MKKRHKSVHAAEIQKNFRIHEEVRRSAAVTETSEKRQKCQPHKIEIKVKYTFHYFNL